MAYHHVSCRKVEDVRRPFPPADICSILLYPAGEESVSYRITGIYVPPDIGMTADKSAWLEDETYQTKDIHGS